MEKAVEVDSEMKERIATTISSNELLVCSPASVVVPNTPEAATPPMAQTYYSDCDDEELEFVRYDQDDVVDFLEEPVAISRVQADAFVQGSRSRECKVTLESARAKLDRVKANRGMHVTKRNLDNFLSGQMDVKVQEQRTQVASKGFLVEKARAKLESVKNKKEITKVKGKRRNRTYITSPVRTRRTASEEKSIDKELSHGVWVRLAKIKLEAAREKKPKSSCKRRSGGVVSGERNVQYKGSSEIARSDRKDEGDDFDTMNAPDGVRVTVECIDAKEAGGKRTRRKTSKHKAVRYSERIANNRLRMQQGLLTVNAKAEKCNKRNYLKRNKRNKQKESSLEEETEVTATQRDPVSSPSLPMEFSSTVEVTPPAKRRKNQRVPVDISAPGARLSTGVECVPPVSPYGLIQEHLYQDPWKVLVACLLLNKTGGRQMHKVIWEFFELCPCAEMCVSTETEKIGRVIHSLGLQNKRAKTLQRFSQDYVETTWTNVTQLHGIGEYARDAYAIFCEGRWQDVQPNDIVLNKYWQWLSATEGQGYGFSQIE